MSSGCHIESLEVEAKKGDPPNVGPPRQKASNLTPIISNSPVSLCHEVILYTFNFLMSAHCNWLPGGVSFKKLLDCALQNEQVWQWFDHEPSPRQLVPAGVYFGQGTFVVGVYACTRV